MAINFGGQIYSKIYFGGREFSQITSRGQTYVSARPATARHIFTITAADQRGYNQPSGNGSISDASYNTPDGTERNIRHCRPVGSVVNFALGGGNIPVAQFPGRIVVKNGSNTVVLARPASVRNISNGRITRADYTVTSGSLDNTFVQGQTFTVELWDI